MSAAAGAPAVAAVAAPAPAKPKYVIRKATVPRPLPKGPPPSRARSAGAPGSAVPVLITPDGAGGKNSARAAGSPSTCLMLHIGNSSSLMVSVGRRDGGEPMVLRSGEQKLSAGSASRASSAGEGASKDKERDKDTWKRMSAFLRGKDVEDALAAEKEAEKNKEKDKSAKKDKEKEAGKKGGLFGKLGKSLLGDKKHEDGPEGAPAPTVATSAPNGTSRSSSPAPSGGSSSGTSSPGGGPSPAASSSSIFPSSTGGGSGMSNGSGSIFPSSVGGGSGGSSIFPSSTGGSIFPSSTGASIFPTITAAASAPSTSSASSAPAAPAPSDVPVPPDDKDLSPEEVTNRAFKRGKVREEMLETEKDYVQDLDCIVNVRVHWLVPADFALLTWP
jgi:hypothetical protein